MNINTDKTSYTPDSPDILVSGYGITVSFADRTGKRTTVLDGLDFDIYKGEILGLAGESGSGKSTLAKTILGMVKCDSGELYVGADKPQMIFQDPYSSLNPAKKISWIMQEPLRLGTDLDKNTRKQKVSEMLSSVGLSDEIGDHKPNELSGGQRQRVCIGTALMRNPELLIADEPVSALDVTVQAQVLELMKDLHRKHGFTMLFISHDLRTMYNFCDRIMILQKGKIVESGKPDEMYRNPRAEYTKLLLESAGITVSK